MNSTTASLLRPLALLLASTLVTSAAVGCSGDSSALGPATAAADAAATEDADAELVTDARAKDAGSGPRDGNSLTCTSSCFGGACVDGRCLPVLLRDDLYMTGFAAGGGKLFVAAGDGIFLLDAEGKNEQLVKDVAGAESLRYVDGKLYWRLGDTGKTLYSMPATGGSVTVVFGPVSTTTLYAYDRNAKYMFWVDGAPSTASGGRLLRAEITAPLPYVGTDFVPSFDARLMMQKQLAVTDAYVFYALNDQAIWRMNVDGSNATKAVSGNHTPENVVADANDVYFVEFDDKLADTVLKRCDLDGKNQTTVHEKVFGGTGGAAHNSGLMAISKDSIYWWRQSDFGLYRLAR